MKTLRTVFSAGGRLRRVRCSRVALLRIRHAVHVVAATGRLAHLIRALRERHHYRDEIKRNHVRRSTLPLQKNWSTRFSRRDRLDSMRSWSSIDRAKMNYTRTGTRRGRSTSDAAQDTNCPLPACSQRPQTDRPRVRRSDPQLLRQGRGSAGKDHASCRSPIISRGNH